MVRERSERDRKEEERVKRAEEEIKEKALFMKLLTNEKEIEEEVEKKFFQAESKPISSKHIEAAFSYPISSEPISPIIDLVVNEETKTHNVQQINQTDLAIEVGYTFNTQYFST